MRRREYKLKSSDRVMSNQPYDLSDANYKERMITMRQECKADQLKN